MPEVIKQAQPHNLILENRHTLTATGIVSIISYDAQSAVLETSLGLLSVGGAGLCVSELSVQTGEVKITGEVEFVQYAAKKQQQGGFFQRLVR
ncbi:MAG: YabP/YqfC family sporulation protein [Ruthenibacterium sp.]